MRSCTIVCRIPPTALLPLWGRVGWARRDWQLPSPIARAAISPTGSTLCPWRGCPTPRWRPTWRPVRCAGTRRKRLRRHWQPLRIFLQNRPVTLRRDIAVCVWYLSIPGGCSLEQTLASLSVFRGPFPSAAALFVTESTPAVLSALHVSHWRPAAGAKWQRTVRGTAPGSDPD